MLRSYTVVVWLLWAHSALAAELPFHINESGIQILLLDNRTTVRLPIRNPSARTLSATMEMEWLAPDDSLASHLKTTLDIPPGESQPLVTFPLPESAEDDQIWYRLRYRIRAEGGEAIGTVSLANSADYVFALRFSVPPRIARGEKCRIRVSARHPVSGKPVSDVKVRGNLYADGDSLEALAISDGSGAASLEFSIPKSVAADEVPLKLEGVLGDYSQSARSAIDIDRRINIRVDVDKPIHQPGQTMHIRLLCLTPSGRAASALRLRLHVVDPDQTAAHIAELETNRFGVAADDWRIPDNTRLGNYNIEAEAIGEGRGASAARTVKVSRYELPDFTVTTKSDRVYYLPGQNAIIEVRAEYLFGKPVARGHVRLVRETSRAWNYQSQKWEIDEAEVTEGDMDESGRLLVPVNLSRRHKDLAADQETRFEDLGFTAYVRDSTSGRTEQRRFDIRITREPIHLHFISSSSSGPSYLIASYADGLPVACRIRIDGREAGSTNRYGLARLFLDDHEEAVTFTVEDSLGLQGHFIEHGQRPRADDLRLRVSTDKTLYHPGEPMQVEVSSNRPVPGVALSVFHDRELLDSRWLDLSGGTVKVELPWRESFAHEVTISVDAGEGWEGLAAKTVMFPASRDLNVKVQMDRATYRPGDEAVATFDAASPSGDSILAALGVAVVDSAVGERARSGSESVRAPSSATWMWDQPTSEAVAGITREDLYRLDNSKPFAEGLDLLAEVLLAFDPYFPSVSRSVDYRRDLQKEFQAIFKEQFELTVEALNRTYRRNYSYPRDMASLKRTLAASGIDFGALRDPWDQPYRAEFATRKSEDILTVRSAGPDKRFGTDDDVTAATVTRAYFKLHHDQIKKALDRLPAMPASLAGVRAALRTAGIHVGALRDPWGTPYGAQVRIYRNRSVLAFHSAGPDRIFATEDDFQVDEISGSYFAETHGKLSGLLLACKSFPEDDNSWTGFLRSSGLFPLKDPWGTDVYAVFQKASRYTDLARYYAAATYGGRPETRVEMVPTTERLYTISVRSAGPDRKRGTSDDFELASFSRTERIETPEDSRRVSESRGRPGDEDVGSIVGRVVDESGGLIPGAEILAIPTAPSPVPDTEYTSRSESDGLYLLDGLPPGLYTLRIRSMGFQQLVVSSVPVTRGKRTVVDATLEVGAVTMVASVSAQAESLQTEASTAVRLSASMGLSTPRLREYFPETMIWAPFLETDANGRAQFRFRLADNITTWKLEAIASSEAGEIGIATVDIRAFQPFFIDPALPPVLTQGDSLQLPVTIRNYLDQAAAVSVSVQPEPWSDAAGSTRQELRVPSDAAASAVFPIHAVSVVNGGKQRFTAESAGAGDAVAKVVTVHPDGRVVIGTANAVLADTRDLDLTFPERSIPGSLHAELKLYPNLLSHVIDGVVGIQRRPYGCAEQAISAAYPSLMILRYLQRLNLSDPDLQASSKQNVRSAVERLVANRRDDGSFAYWGRGEGDVSLTAYALTFLTQAQEFVEVDESLVSYAMKWLLKRQGQNGAWAAFDWKGLFDGQRTAYQTVQAASALSGPNAAPQVARALQYLLGAKGSIDEPYMIAAMALLAEETKQISTMEAMLSSLRRLAREESGLTYWNLESNTPFYGWGLAGRLEATALAVQALARAAQPADKTLIDSGVLFLMRNKDQYGVWWSTQATVKVLEAILAAEVDQIANSDGGAAEVLVGERSVAQLIMPAARQVTGPMRVDLSPYLTPGTNRVSLRRAAGGNLAQIQIASSYYIPWNGGPDPTQTGVLRLNVAFDKTTAQPKDYITCRVRAERVGFSGYGMMMAEIGLPPGVDVDRHSLDDAVSSHGLAVDHYDVLPDRIQFYLWPRAGGTSFEFRFQPRFAMVAKSSESVLYDYYNPEARVVVEPTTFHVGAASNGVAAGR
jgi:hypothetical protein